MLRYWTAAPAAADSAVQVYAAERHHRLDSVPQWQGLFAEAAAESRLDPANQQTHQNRE